MVPADVDDKEQKDVVNKIKELLNTRIREVEKNASSSQAAQTGTATKDEPTTQLPDLVRATTPTTTTTSTTTTTVYVPPPSEPPVVVETTTPAPSDPGFFARVGEFLSNLTNFSNFSFGPIVFGRK